MSKVTINSVDDLQNFVDQQAKKLKKKQLILLNGSLGAGKTQYVKCLVKALGGEQVASPSFAICHTYKVKNNQVHHFDLYRLENEDDLESTGFWDFFSNEEGIIVIEWPEKIDKSHLPQNWPQIEINIEVKNQSRHITIS